MHTASSRSAKLAVTVSSNIETPDTDEVRTVTVPMHDRIRTGTLRRIMEQAGGSDFEAFCRWIENTL
jgi:hypothetical protein